MTYQDIQLKQNEINKHQMITINVDLVIEPHNEKRFDSLMEK